MAGRPHDWNPVADSDPVPGDPDRVAGLGKKLRRTADELSRQIRNLKAVAEVDAWDSDAGREFRKKAEGNVGKLQAAYQRYDAAADALGTRVDEIGGGYHDKLHAKPTNYATDLNRAQEIADAALKEAKSADERKGEAQRTLDHLSGDAETSKKRELEDTLDTSGGDIAAAREKIEEAKRIRDAAAKRARDAIDTAISGDSLEDGFWDTFVDVLADITSTIATWCGVASMLVGWIPVIGQALAGLLGTVAMVATLVNLACTVYQLLRGQAELKDLAMSALGFMMMGVGKAFGKIAGKFAGKALRRLTKASKAGGRGSGKSFRRTNKKLNKMAGEKIKLSGREKLEAFKEPFADVLTRKGWKQTAENFKTLRPGSGNYKAAWNEMQSRGGSVMGPVRSVSFADPGVASDLQAAKYAAKGLDQFPAVNEITQKATALTVTGTAITGGGLAIDGNLNPLVD